VDLDKVLVRAREMVDAGAMILDVGGESTRPGAQAVSPEEEIARVVPVIECLRGELDVCLSIDSSEPGVIDAAIRSGAHFVNDVRALNVEGALEIVAGSEAGVCLMHMQGQPRTMQEQYHYEDVVRDVGQFLARQLERCEAAGIDRRRIVIDPGFGFGKSVDHNFQLLDRLETLSAIGVPVLVGISRKSMIGAVTGRRVDQRLAGSIAAAAIALQRGARIIRSHDVAATVDAIRVHCALAASRSEDLGDA
jgi:dihydropteroate synthase